MVAKGKPFRDPDSARFALEELMTMEENRLKRELPQLEERALNAAIKGGFLKEGARLRDLTSEEKAKLFTCSEEYREYRNCLTSLDRFD